MARIFGAFLGFYGIIGTESLNLNKNLKRGASAMFGSKKHTKDQHNFDKEIHEAEEKSEKRHHYRRYQQQGNEEDFTVLIID